MGLEVALIAVGAAAMVGGAAYSAYTAYEAKEMQEDAQRDYEKRVKAAIAEAEQNAQDFEAQLKYEEDTFDPYKMDNAFTSLYEGVVRPLEVDFEENLIPELRNSFNVGASGNAYSSGAAKSAEAEARRDLSMNKATLRTQERDKMISRAYMDYDRRINNLSLGYQAEGNVINTKMGGAAGVYGAAQDTAASHAAFGQSVGQLGASVGGAAMMGLNAYNTNRFVNAYTAGGAAPSAGQVQLWEAQGSMGGGGGR